jgi:hypothetical protein
VSNSEQLAVRARSRLLTLHKRHTRLTSEKNYMTTFVPLLSKDQIDRLPERAREVVEYRKSGLSLNHIQGCSLGCAYCIRHTYGLWDQDQPAALMSDAEAVEELVTHRYFQPHVTPVQLFNRATEPFLPKVRPHTFAILEDLAERELTNHVLVITRHQMKPYDIDRLNQLRHVKVTLLFTYYRHRQQGHRALPITRRGRLAEAHERAPAAEVPDRLVLAPARAWSQRHRRAPGRRARAKQARRRHCVHRLILPRPDRRVLQDERLARALRRHGASENRARDA